MQTLLTNFNGNKQIRVGERLVSFEEPQIMGILNLTPDSFYDGGKWKSDADFLTGAEKILSSGTAILDLGAMSSRPGAKTISTEEELNRLLPGVDLVRKNFPEAVISIDTFRWEVARAVLEKGPAIINDISGGEISDFKIWEEVAAFKVPYILMHIQGVPETMQSNPIYDNVVLEVFDYFAQKSEKLRSFGITDIILDPGFGFGKTLQDNYDLLSGLGLFHSLGYPLMVGLSRKSMIYRLLETGPDLALNGTTGLHMVALLNGAKILRVHDVEPAKEAVRLFLQLQNSGYKYGDD